MNTSARRQLRHRRHRSVNVQLTERDRIVLHALARFRLARTSTLVTYAFAGVRRDTAAVRLRRLFDSRHLSVLPSQQTSENIYRLGPAGKACLLEEGIAAGRVPRGGHEHHLAIVETWVTVAGLEDVTVERALPDWELREQFSTAELRVVPDLFLLVRASGQSHVVAVEVDRGTESLAVLTRKLEAYRSLWGQPPGLFGHEQFGIAVACYAPSRRPTLAAALKKVWVVPCVLWAGSEEPSSALRKLLSDLEDPLAGSPYSKGSLQGEER